ncbi:MAG: helix-turn-helix transcriptional regulator [Oscillospiraceae bacterium]|nr:helix-turn-helix transcriptional regulator [Oscillospiraceae bacterium]
MINDVRNDTLNHNGGFPIRLYIERELPNGKEPVPLHRHLELELLVVYRGTLELHTVTDNIELHEGEGVLINSGVMHSLSHGEDCRCAYAMFSDEFIAPAGSDVSLKYVKPFVMNNELPYVLLTPHIEWQNDILQLSGRVFALLHGSSDDELPEALRRFERESPCAELDIQRLVSELWRGLYVNMGASMRSGVTGNEYVVRRRTQMMIDFIRRSYRSQITLQDIADAANISKSEASRCFQSCLHTSPVSYLLKYRIEVAGHLLRSTSMTIEAISFECGFGSASYFCKMFQRHTGKTPGSFRGR